MSYVDEIMNKVDSYSLFLGRGAREQRLYSKYIACMRAVEWSSKFGKEREGRHATVVGVMLRRLNTGLFPFRHNGYQQDPGRESFWRCENTVRTPREH